MTPKGLSSYLRTNLDALKDDKACFSKVDSTDDKDYAVAFSDSQDLQMLRQKFLRAASTLYSCLTVVETCASYCSQFSNVTSDVSGRRPMVEINFYIQQLQIHSQSITRSIHQLEGTNQLVGDLMSAKTC